MKVLSLTTTGKKSTATVSDALFAAPVNKQVLSQAIRVYLSNLRQGTSRVKNRGEVNLTKRKWYRQKGTGNARHGAQSAPIFVGGGVAHGPKGIENWSRSLPQRTKHQALISALSAQAEKVVMVESVFELDGKTKAAASLLQAVAPNTEKILVIVPERKPEVIRSMRNLPNVLVRTAERVNALEVSNADWVVTTKAAVGVLEDRLKVASTKSAQAK